MDRIDTASAGPNVNGPGKRGFRDEDLPSGVQATRFSADWCNGIQEEIANLIEDVGISLDKSQKSQLLNAVNSKIEAATGGGGGGGGVTSARRRAASGRPDFLRATGTGGSAMVIASEADPLIITARGRTNTITAPVNLTGLPASPSSRNTFAIPATAFDGKLEKTTGELGYIFDESIPHGEIPMSSVEQVPSARRGKLAAFKMTLAGQTEYFMAKIDPDQKRLTNVLRRCFLNSTGNPWANVEGSISAIGAITIVNLIAVFRDLDAGEFITPRADRITEADAAPASPQAGDLWLNTRTDVWSRFENSEFAEANLVLCGYLVVDGADCVASRSAEIARPYSNSNNIELSILSTNSIALANANAHVSVYGEVKRFLATAEWGSGNLVAGVSLAANTDFFFYVADNGSRIIDTAPPQYRQDLRGYYHPVEAWRCVGRFRTDASSQFSATRNHFPWQKYAQHGRIPITDTFERLSSGNTGETLFSTGTRRTAQGTYEVSFKDALFTVPPVATIMGLGNAVAIIGSAFTLESFRYNLRNPQGGAVVNSTSYLVITRRGRDLLQARLDSSLKG